MTTRRTSVYVEGLGHAGLPIPDACRVDNVVYSGGVNGADQSGNLPGEVRDEVCQMFSNLATIAQSSGAHLDDVVRITVFLRERDPQLMSALNGAWTSTFPDPASRPARHVLIQPIHDALRIQCDFVAVVAADIQERS